MPSQAEHLPLHHRPAEVMKGLIHRVHRHLPGQARPSSHALQQKCNQKGQGAALWDMVSLRTYGYWEVWTLW